MRGTCCSRTKTTSPTMPRAIKFPTAGSDWDESKVLDKADVIRDDQAMNTSVRFATLMCFFRHLKHSELAEHMQKHNGRVVLRGDKVKDDTGCKAAITEHGAFASQMIASKVFWTL